MNRPPNHYLSKCQYLPEQDRKFMAKARLIATLDDHNESDEILSPDESVTSQVATVTLPPSTTRRITKYKYK